MLALTSEESITICLFKPVTFKSKLIWSDMTIGYAPAQHYYRKSFWNDLLAKLLANLEKQCAYTNVN